MPRKGSNLSSKQKNEVYVASGSTHPELALGIADCMGVELGPVELKQFPDTELYVRYGDSVRGKQMFIVQSLAAARGRSVNDAFVEATIMADAAVRASASEITLVAPYLAYSRQDRKARGREPITVARILSTLAHTGVNRVVSSDLHTQQIQGMFDGPYDHLVMEPVLRKSLKKRIGDQKDEFVVVAPDEGRVKSDSKFADRLGIDMVTIPKTRSRSNPSTIQRPKKVAGVKGRNALMVDDMIDTAGTIVTAAETLKRSGAKSVTVAATHALFSDPALERLSDAPIDKIVVTDTVPVDVAKTELGDRLEVVSCAPLFGRALIEIVTGGSVSKIFKGRNAE